MFLLLILCVLAYIVFTYQITIDTVIVGKEYKILMYYNKYNGNEVTREYIILYRKYRIKI